MKRRLSSKVSACAWKTARSWQADFTQALKKAIPMLESPFSLPRPQRQ